MEICLNYNENNIQFTYKIPCKKRIIDDNLTMLL